MTQSDSYAQIEEEFAHVFSTSAIRTFKVQCDMEMAPLTMFEKGKESLPGFTVNGILSINSPVIQGSLVLCFTKDVFLEVLRRLFQDPTIEEIAEDAADAAAEILNILYAQAKTILNKKGYAVQMAIPSIMRGEEVSSVHDKRQNVKIIPFQMECGRLYLELSTMDPSKNKSKEPEKPAAESTGKVPVATKALFINQFVQATILTLKTQFQVETKHGKPFEKASENYIPFDVGASIGIVSNTVNGSFLIAFPKEVYCKLVEKIFGELPADVSPENTDLVAEVANMTLGAAKQVLNSQGHGIQMALPTIIHGREIHSNLPKGRKVFVMPFDTELGPFHAEIDVVE